MAVSLTAHRCLDLMLAQFLIVVGTVLASTVGVVLASFGRLAQSHLQCSDRQIAFHLIADSPAVNAPEMQIENDREIESAFARPCIADFTGPFLNGCIDMEAPVQQVWRDIEGVIAVGCHLEFL